MIAGPLDLGAYSPFKIPVKNFHTGLIPIPGGYAVPYGDHADPDEWKLRIWIKAPASVGQYAAGTQAACEFLARQLEEMVRNPDTQPIYLQFYAGTGVVALPQNFSQPQDGWYYVTQLTVDYTKSLFGFTVVDFTVQSVSPGAPRRVGIWNAGGALSSTYSGAAVNWVAFPQNAVLPWTARRQGGEALVQIVAAPAVNPFPFVPSATISDWWLGGCHVYDAMAPIGTNPVPAPPTFLNANWIEVFGTDHKFVGDAVITNGLQLITLSPGSNSAPCYLWNTALGTPGWQQYAAVAYQDDGTISGILRQISLTRVGSEEIQCQLIEVTSSPNLGKLTLRLQRGAYAVRWVLDPLTQANTSQYALQMNLPASPKILYNSTAVVDNGLSAQAQAAIPTDYGYGAFIIASSSYPFISGWLYQNAPQYQPYYQNSQFMAFGDTSGPAQNNSRTYGIFAFPFSNPQNLQCEWEVGGFGAGYSNVVDAAASAGHALKLANGTLIANGVAGCGAGGNSTFTPQAGGYAVWVRAKCTTGTSGTAQLQIGDAVGGVFRASTTFAPSAFGTTYTWKQCGTTDNLDGATTINFRAALTGTANDDFFLDEIVLVPLTSGSTVSFPQDLWQQFLYERTTRQVLG